MIQSYFLPAGNRFVLKLLTLFYFFLLLPDVIVSQIVIPNSLQVCDDDSGFTLPQLISTHLNYFTDPDIENIEFQGDLQLDSTVTYQTFDAFGGNYISVPFSKNAYLYPNEKTVVEIGYIREVTWKPSEKLTRVYDDQNRLFVILAESQDQEQPVWKPDSRAKIFFRGNADNNYDSILIQVWSESTDSWTEALKLENMFNEGNQLLESITKINFDDSTQWLLKDLYTYDNQGHNIKTHSYLIDSSGIEIPISMVEHIYLLNYLIESVTSTSDFQGGFYPESKVRYAYTSQSRYDSVRCYQYSFISDDWEVTEENSYDYDSQYRLEKRNHVKYVEGQVSEHKIDKFTYIQEHFPDTHHELEGALISGMEIPRFQTKFYYDASTVPTDNPKGFDLIEIFPNPTQDYITIRGLRNRKIKVFDHYGHLLAEYHQNSESAVIDISNYPPGNYLLQVVDDQASFTKKIVRS